MVMALGWRGEILTDPTATSKHRLLAANALVAVCAELSSPESAVYATLPTAIAATTGRLPRSEQMFDLPNAAIFTGRYDREKQLEQWNKALLTARYLAGATGQSFYSTGTFRDVGLVVPVHDARPHSVYTEIRWQRNVHDRMFERINASLVFMGMKRRYNVAANEFLAEVQRYTRVLATRPGSSFDVPSSVGYMDYAFGVPAVHAALDEYMELQQRKISAQQQPHDLKATPAQHLNDNRIEYGTTEERNRHIAMLQHVYKKYFIQGVILGQHIELR